MVKGRLSISRSNIDHQITLILENKETGNRVVQIEISPENFAKALTGLQSQLCDYHVYQKIKKEND